MDFGSLPPEINSARMYSGPGSGPMLAAAAAWEWLAAELHTTAGDYESVISQLTSGAWLGPASASMAAAASTYVAWLRTTASQAEQSATQARAAAGVYESARAMTVPPPVIAANRILLMSLVATNILGQNTPAIAATEFHYGQMWAQDAAAMYGYAAGSAAATKVTPFTSPPATGNPAGLAAQGAAVAQAVGTSAPTNAQALSQLTSAVPGVLAQLAGSTGQPTGLADAASVLGLTLEPSGSGVIVGGVLGDILAGLSGSSTLNAATPFNLFARQVSNVRLFATAFRDIEGLGSKALEPFGKAAKAAEGAAKAGSATLGGGLGSVLGGGLGAAGWGGAGGSAAAAGLGRAASIGVLSVPQSWAAAVPAVSSTAAPVSASGALNAIPVSGPAGPAGVPVMPITGMAGNGAGRLADAAGARFLPRPNMLPRWPAGG